MEICTENVTYMCLHYSGKILHYTGIEWCDMPFVDYQKNKPVVLLKDSLVKCNLQQYNWYASNKMFLSIMCKTNNTIILNILQYYYILLKPNTASQVL